MKTRASLHAVVLLGILNAGTAAVAETTADKIFRLHEVTIDGIHAGIKSGATSCKGIVEAYIARARAYNGTCTMPVTADGGAVSKVKGAVRAGAPVTFPTKSVAITKLFPDFQNYVGFRPDYGRMEPTMSDPTVYQQYGMVVGIPNAKQVNALETLAIRGERSVTCKGAFDAHPSTGPLPPDAPAVCEKFRQQPDALEYAAQLDAEYGKNPDLKKHPLYCVPMGFKAIYDAKDMRSTGGGDVKYAADFAPRDSTLTSRVRAAGAIIYAQTHNSEYNGGSGDPGGELKVSRPTLGQGGSRETWGGMSCNPYDTTRVTSGSSGGTAVAVAANLVVCSICETTGGSCRGPANFQNLVNVVPTKGIISFGGSIGANPYHDRPGVYCRTVKDATTVLEAFRDPKTGFFDSRDPYTALPRVIASKTSYVNALVSPAESKPLKGMRIGVIRELMIKVNPSDAAVSDGINSQLKVLQDLGAELIETTDPQYPDDPSIPNMDYTFNDAIAEIVPFHLPEVFQWQKDGKPEFQLAGYDVTSREYLVKAAALKAPLPKNLNFRRIFANPPTDPNAVTGYTFSYQFAEYLAKRGDERVYDWKTLNENAKYYNEQRRVAMKNWENKPIDIRTNAVAYSMRRRDTLRMVMMKVLQQNQIDVFVNPVNPTLPPKIAGASETENRQGFGYGAMLGIPEVFVPAGFSEEVYDATFKLSEDGTKYDGVSGKVATKVPGGLPFNIAFWAGPGEEATLLKVASAYEAATHHRKAPKDFGPVKGEPQ
jgi:amidase